jgi:hypothetical protein
VTSDGEDNEAGVTRRYRNLAKRRVHFWNRWRREYLADLREHHKVSTKNGNRKVSIGDVVLVYEENVKRGKWRVGRIESLVTGRDQEVRGERVKVNTRETGRTVYLNIPLEKLYPIELGESERKDNKVENEVNGYENQKGKKKMNKKGKMEMNEKDGEKGKVENCVQHVLRWMHDGETDLCLSHDSSREGVSNIL